MNIFVFGNPELPRDRLPLALVPSLRQLLPDVSFMEIDPSEEWDAPAHVILLDTVEGTEGVRVYNGLEFFKDSPRVTLHDLDALAHLQLLVKLGKVKHVTVIGVGPETPRDTAPTAIVSAIRAIS